MDKLNYLLLDNIDTSSDNWKEDEAIYRRTLSTVGEYWTNKEETILFPYNTPILEMRFGKLHRLGVFECIMRYGIHACDDISERGTVKLADTKTYQDLSNMSMDIESSLIGKASDLEFKLKKQGEDIVNKINKRFKDANAFYSTKDKDLFIIVIGHNIYYHPKFKKLRDKITSKFYNEFDQSRIYFEYIKK